MESTGNSIVVHFSAIPSSDYFCQELVIAIRTSASTEVAGKGKANLI